MKKFGFIVSFAVCRKENLNPMLGSIMLCFLDQHAGAIQAVAATLGFFGLVYYCRLTRDIREATLQQLSASYRPHIVVDDGREADHPDFKVKSPTVVRNLGNGVALGVSWRPVTSSATQWINLGDLAPRDWSDIGTADFPRMFEECWPADGFDIQFTNLAGKKFLTTVRMPDTTVLQSCSELSSQNSVKPHSDPTQTNQSK